MRGLVLGDVPREEGATETVGLLFADQGCVSFTADDPGLALNGMAVLVRKDERDGHVTELLPHLGQQQFTIPTDGVIDAAVPGVDEFFGGLLTEVRAVRFGGVPRDQLVDRFEGLVEQSRVLGGPVGFDVCDGVGCQRVDVPAVGAGDCSVGVGGSRTQPTWSCRCVESGDAEGIVINRDGVATRSLGTTGEQCGHSQQ